MTLINFNTSTSLDVYLSSETPNQQINWSLKKLLVDPVLNPNTGNSFPALGKQLIVYGATTVSSLLSPVPLNIAMADVASLTQKNLLRTAVLYFQNLASERQAVGQEPGIAKYSNKIKYAFLATSILSGFLADYYTNNNYQIGQSLIGITITDLQRELRLFLINKVKNEQGKNIKVGRPLALKIALLSLLAFATISGASMGMNPILLSGLISAAGVTVKCTKEIEKASTTMLGFLAGSGLVTAGMLDVAIYSLKNREFPDIDTLTSEHFATNATGLLMYVILTKLKNSLLKWQIGEDDDDEEMEIKRPTQPQKQIESTDQSTENSEDKTETALLKQMMVTCLIMGIAFRLMMVQSRSTKTTVKKTKASKTSSVTSLITSNVASTGSRMGVNIIKQISKADKAVMLLAVGLLGIQMAMEPFKDDLGVVPLTSLTLLSVFSTNLIAKRVKFWQLGRTFLLADSAQGH